MYERSTPPVSRIRSLAELSMRKVRVTRQGYDSNGKYWGEGDDVLCALHEDKRWNPDSVVDSFLGKFFALIEKAI